MGRSLDEPFTLYGLLAESVETDSERSWVEFTLRENARFSDGSPVTVEDVIWSYQTLGTEGHGRYAGFWSQVETIEATGSRSVKLTFADENRELALLAGMRPILKKAQWDGKSFADARLEDIPIGAGPYVIDDYEAGRFVRLKRDPNYYGVDVPFRKGTMNFDEIQLDFYGDGGVLLEGFRAGQISAVREFNAETWNSQYNFPRAQSGEVVKTEIYHNKPSGITGFVMNTRRPPFDDWRVREALITAFNFEYINETITGGAQPRITSYFSNSVLAMQPGPASGQVAALLEPFTEELLPGVLEGYTLPASDGSLRDRRGLRRALDLLAEAGWTPDDGALRNEAGETFAFEVLLSQKSSENRKIADLYVSALKGLGVDAKITLVDEAQWTDRTRNFDFDMTYYRRALSLSPGNEQKFYWGSESAEQPGSRNQMGVQSPAVDAVIDTMLTTEDPETFRAAVQALDRLLIAGRYVIPFWQFTAGRIAHVAEMQRPEVTPSYGDGPDYMPQLWWWDETARP